MKLKLLSLALVIVMVSCDKKDHVSPANPTTTQGRTSPVGPSGPTGPTNKDSVSVLIDSVPSAGWKSRSGLYSATLADAYILNSGSGIVSVAVATSYNSQPNWFALPFTNLLQAGDEMEFSYSSFSVTLEYSYSTPPAQTLYFRITTITPAVTQKKSNNIDAVTN